MLAVYAGYSLQGEYVPAGPALRPYVQDALDEIQYATGSTRTVWGARRAADGHPAPFTVPYVEIGNEDFFDRSGSYEQRFAQFYDAIRKAYPAIKLIATTTVSSRTPDIYDQHFYMSPQWFIDHDSYYDSYSRSGPRIFVGEYAAQTDAIGQGEATLGAALGEATWMTGLERNADLIVMAAYAPLFANVNLTQWNPDLIGFDSLSSYGSPSYYVQQLFSRNYGDVVVPTTISGGAALAVVASRDTHNGRIFIIVVNTSSSAQSTHIVVKGGAAVAARGSATVLTSGSLDDQNSLSEPAKVAPRSRQVDHLGSAFNFSFQPNSVTVLRLATGAGAA
jgi:alpha-L-arabinofuranosidase